MMSVVYKRHLHVITKNYVRSWAPYSINCRSSKEIIRFYSIIGKKTNQLSVSDADQEIPTLGSTDNAGNMVNLVSDIIHYPRVGTSLSA